MIRHGRLPRTHQAALPLPGCACRCMGQPWGGASTEASALAAGAAAAAEEEEAAPILTWEMVKHLRINRFRGSNPHYRLSMRDKCFVSPFHWNVNGPKPAQFIVNEQLLSVIFNSCFLRCNFTSRPSWGAFHSRVEDLWNSPPQVNYLNIRYRDDLSVPRRTKTGFR